MSSNVFTPSEELFKIAKCDPQSFITKSDYELLANEYYDIYVAPFIEDLKSKNINEDYIRATKLRFKYYIQFCIDLYEPAVESTIGKISVCMRYIHNTITDPRNKSCVVYPLDSLIIIIMLAHMYGYYDAQSIANFYKEHLLEIQLLVPGVPPLDCLLSKSTINTVFKLVDKEDIENLLKEYFATINSSIQKLITYDDDKYKECNYETLDTLAFDGQEMRSTFKRGEGSRRKKGGNIVTLYNCSKRLAKAYKITDKKNNESLAFLSMAATTSIADNVVMSDALNTSSDVTNYITEKDAYYLMPIKNYRGNNELLNHIEAIFNRQCKDSLKTYKNYKDHGRIEDICIEILPASLYIDKRIKNEHKNLNTIVKYTKKVTRVVDKVETCNTRYYISSLPFLGDETLQQVWTSIRDYWFIEQNHNLLDGPLFNQDLFQSCNINSISNHAGFNKIRQYILSCIRQELTEISDKKKPATFRETQIYINDQPLFIAFSYIHKFMTQNQ